MTDIKTRKDLATMLNMNEKTFREYLQLAHDFEILKNNIDEEIFSQFEKVFTEICQNKKKKISNDALGKMVTLPLEMQKQLTKEVVEKPERAKEIVSRYIKSLSEIKITVKLPFEINEFYKTKADQVGRSKTEYIESTLRLIARMDNID